MKTYTKNQVLQLLVNLLVVGGANNNQGIKPNKLSGRSYGEKANLILDVFDNNPEAQRFAISLQKSM